MYADLFVVLALTCYLYWNRWKLPSGKRYPPGPRGLPFVGRFFHDMKEIFLPEVMSEWKKEYGDIVSIEILGRRMVFIFSSDIARDLFEKRGSIYSSRPSQPMPSLLGWDFAIGFMPYGSWWRRHVRAFHQLFNSRAVLGFEPLQTSLRDRLLRNLLQAPDGFVDHINYEGAHVVLDSIYAIEIKPKNDPYLELMHLGLEGISHTLIPGTYIVDRFPIFNYLPNWIPGIPFKKILKKYGRAAAESIEIPFAIVKNQGKLNYSFVSTSLERLRKSNELPSDEEEVIRNVAGVAYAAGAATTSTAIINGVLASVLYPAVQRKVQAELDEVLGDHLPTLEDRERLPYTKAFCDEIVRWRSIVPLAIPHAVIEDDIYGDYFIPKGSVVIGDTWQMLHSEKYGPEPTKFNPDRFFEPGIPSPIEQFGFGRRACPGRFLAINTLFLYMASILKVFNIVPAKNADGDDIPIPTGIFPSALPQPEPFRCDFKVRSSRAKDLIQVDSKE